jgi:alkylation response protein AidB-like acyl-CoA dehydrogenase
MEAVGNYAAPYAMGMEEVGKNDYGVGPDYSNFASEMYFNMRKTSIYGGSNEIQRNIITKMILGL